MLTDSVSTLVLAIPYHRLPSAFLPLARSRYGQVGRFWTFPRSRGTVLLQGFEGKVADQMDGPRIHQLPAFHRSQRRLDVRRLHVGDTHAGHQAFSGEKGEGSDNNDAMAITMMAMSGCSALDCKRY